MSNLTKAKKEETKNTALALPFDISGDVGAGTEGADRDSYAIPFLRVLQKISPQCDEADAAYVEGAKGGMLFNSVTGDLYDGKEGVTFLPCAFQRRFLRWAPRGSDGGYKGELAPEEVARMQADGRVVEIEGRLYVADENGEANEKRSDRLTDTRSHFGIVIGPNGPQQVLLALSSTQIKKSKQLMSILSSAKIKTAQGLITPPTWLNAIKITSVLESNDQGSWYGVKFEANGFIEDADLYAAGKAFHAAIAGGEVKANYAEPAEEGNKF